MTNICKKWISAPQCLRISIAILYVYTTLTIHFYHTCHQNSKKPHACISKCSGCCHLHKDGLTNINVSSLSDHSSSDNSDISYSGICLACLYSATAKSSTPNIVTPLLSIQAALPNQVLPKSSFPKRLEWLSSISLRAPPAIIS